jgi:hypothetical protein
MLLSWIWIVLGLLQTPAAPAPAPSEQPKVTCVACKGTGDARQDCVECAGERTVACVRCYPLHWALAEQATARRLAEIFPDEQAFELRKVHLETAVASLQLLWQLKWGGASAVDSPLTIACPAACLDGVGRVARNPCKYCAGKGRFACPDCAATGTTPCRFCEGKGGVKRRCDACDGSGRVSVPTSAPTAEHCDWCVDARWRACRRCEGHKGARQICRRCNGAKSGLCLSCLGSKRTPCRDCRGEGVVRDPSKPTQIVYCKECGKSGKRPCTVCAGDGRIRCEMCEGKGSVVAGCFDCLDSRRVPCRGCTELSSRAWEAGAELLVSTGNPQLAKAYWRVAGERLEQRFEAQMKLAPSEVRRSQLAAWRAAERKRRNERAAEWKP